HVVFVRVLGVNQLADVKLNFEVELFDSHALLGATLDINLDPADRVVVESPMPESAQIERTAQLAINPRQHVEIECRRDTERVVISSFENRGIFLQVRAEQECVVL